MYAKLICSIVQNRCFFNISAGTIDGSPPVQWRVYGFPPLLSPVGTIESAPINKPCYAALSIVFKGLIGIGVSVPTTKVVGYHQLALQAKRYLCIAPVDIL